MNKKKGLVLLPLAAIGFVLAVVLFYTTAVDQTPGGSLYIGDAQSAIYDTYAQGEEMLFFLDTAAYHSIEYAKNSSDVEFEFEKAFSAYLELFNAFYDQDLDVYYYDIQVKGGEVIGITSQYITLNSDRIEYKLNPNFRVSFEPVPEPEEEVTDSLI